ncbi:MAG: NusG domain II-containing protein [Clostridiales Family XIII bacterium]|jgi:hypothetical protein|nr:NusG domain II-containing protein [Clostridiales Family XIII bacterium]
MRKAVKEMRIPIKKADAILIAVLLAVSAAGGIVAARAGSFESGANLRITVGGELRGVYPLTEAREILVNANYENRIVIEKSEAGKVRVYMRSATCPGKDCVHHAPIALNGQSIICLPNRLTAEIAGEESDIDAFAY